MLSVVTSLLATLASSSPDPVLHLRADTAIVLDSKGAVARWTDLSPRGTDFASLDSARRPVSTRSGLQGRPSVRFKGAHILADTVSSLPLDSGFTLFFVAQDSNPSAQSAFLNKGENDFSVDLWGSTAGNFQFSQAWVVTVAQTNFQTIEPMLYEATFDGRTSRLFVAGRLEDTGTFAGKATRSKTTWLGGAWHGNWQGYFDGHVGEVVVYPVELDDSTRIRIESELLDAWRIERLGVWVRPPVASSDPVAILHLRADSSMVLDSKGAVRTWTDLSARHTDFHALDGSGRADSALRPVFSATALGGKPAVVFTGGDVLSDTTNIPLDSGFTLFFVARDRNLAEYSAFLDKCENDIGVNLWNGNVGNFQVGQSWVKVFAQSSIQTSAPALYEASWNGDTARLYIHGLELAKAYGTPTGLVRARTTWLGGNYHLADGGLNHFLTGDVSEVLLFAGALADSTRKRMESELIARWGLERPFEIPTGVGPRSASSNPAGFGLSRRDDHWVVASPNGLKATLLDARGAVVADATFTEGTASLPASKGLGIVRVESAIGTESRLVVSPR